MSLTPQQKERAVYLLRVIVAPASDPGDAAWEQELYKAMDEARMLLGFPAREKPQPRRSYYGIRKSK